MGENRVMSHIHGGGGGGSGSSGFAHDDQGIGDSGLCDDGLVVCGSQLEACR